MNIAVIHVRLPESGDIFDVEIELNEFQVQMVIYNLPTYQFEKSMVNDITLTEMKENEKADISMVTLSVFYVIIETV